MILDAHASLEAFLRAHALGGSGIAVAFDVPGKAWAAARKEPAVNCFLYDVRENQAVKHTGKAPVRDASGRVVGHRPVPRYLDHCYLLTAWAPDAPHEHRLLSAVLGALLVHDTLPRDVLQGALAAQPRHVVLSVAQGGKRGMLLSFAGEQRLAIELELAVPWSGGPDEIVAGHVEQLPRITVLERPPGSRTVQRRVAVVAQRAPVAATTPAATTQAATTPAATTHAAPVAQPAPATLPAAAASPYGTQAGARLGATLAVRLLAQLQAPAAADDVPAAQAAAQLGAQIASRLAALAERGPGEPVASPQAPPTARQVAAARLGAAAGTTLLARLRSAVDGASVPTSEQAGRLGAQVGAALARAVLSGPPPEPAPGPPLSPAP